MAGAQGRALPDGSQGCLREGGAETLPVGCLGSKGGRCRVGRRWGPRSSRLRSSSIRQGSHGSSRSGGPADGLSAQAPEIVQRPGVGIQPGQT